MSAKKIEIEMETLGNERKKIFGFIEQKDFILILLAFLIPFFSWGTVMLRGMSHVINPGDPTYTFMLLLPIILFVLAAWSGSLTTSILISLVASAGFLIVGMPYYWNPAGWTPGTYPPDPVSLFSDCSKLLLNLLAPGMLGGILSQFGVISAAKNDLKELLHRPLAMLILIGALLGSVLLYGRASASTLTATNPVTFAFLLLGAMAIVIVVAYAAGTAYGGLTVGFLVALVYYSAAAAKDPAAEILGVFSIGIANWVLGAGLDLNLQSFYLAYGLGFLIAALWGSIWGVLGKYMVYVTPAKKSEETIKVAHVFRDLWSNYFIFGKNTRPEFRLKQAAGSTVQEGATLTGILGTPGAKAEYVTYRYLDRKKRFETVEASVGGILVEPSEKGMAKVYHRDYKARGVEEKKMVGEFYDPKPLFDKYTPMWSPFALSVREYLSKVLNPLVLIPIIVGAIFFAPLILEAYKYIFSGTAPPAAAWVLIAQVAIVILLLGYLFLWRRKIPTALKAHPEGALAFVFAVLVIGVLFIFSFQFLSGLILLIQSESIDLSLTLATNAVLFLLIVSIFTSLSTVQMLGADNFNVYFYDDKDKDLNPYKNDYDKPQWLKGSHYWIFRHMYFWPFEATPSLKGFAHEDFERVEVWVNADTGKPEWSLSDYHWRELWYKIPELDEDIAIQASFNKNFHTPSVSVIRRSHLKEVKYAGESWFGSLEMMFHYLRVSRELKKEMLVPPKVSKKRAETLQNFFVDLPPAIRLAAAGTMAGFAWNFFRYPQGVSTVAKVDGTEKYVYREKDYRPPYVEKVVGGNPLAEPNDGLGAPAVLDDKAPQLCPKCGKALPTSLVCSNCKTDAKVESFLNIM
ncbi:MAG: hypothetical protein WED04_00265 [Promethearchaeati archaeon SRVP18_Atabeyarchaeia-1]